MSEVEPTTVPGTEEAVDTPSEPLSLKVLQVVKGAQLQHGLRHEDYERYRFCARLCILLDDSMDLVTRLRLSMIFLQS